MEFGANLVHLISEFKNEETLDEDLIQVINEAAMIISSDTSGYNVEQVTGVDHALLYGYRNDKRSLEAMQLGTAMKLASFPFSHFNENSINVIEKMGKISKSNVINRPTLLSKMTGIPRNQLRHLKTTDAMMTMNILSVLKTLNFYNQVKKTTGAEIR